VCYQLFVKALLSKMGKSCTSRVSKQLVYARENSIIRPVRIARGYACGRRQRGRYRSLSSLSCDP
jgi:hypothetical protein